MNCYFCVRSLKVTMLILTLAACDSREQERYEPPVRGLKAYEVSELARSETRRYPSVVEPSQETRLSFELAGKLGDIKLEVGQRVTQNTVLAGIDSVSLQLRVESAQAALEDAHAQQQTARADFERKGQLLGKKYVTQAQFEDAQNVLKSISAKVEQARKELSLAREDLLNTELIAPFDGVVSSIEAEDFSQVAPGDVIIGLYSENSYELVISVPAVIVRSLVVGDLAKVTFADLPGQVAEARIKEIGARATQVSAFPVVVALDGFPDTISAGIAADVEVTISLVDQAGGFLVPLSSLLMTSGGLENLPNGPGSLVSAELFLYEAESSRVVKRMVQLEGIRGNKAIVTQGVKQGDIVASAGISYLKDGQKVRLLPLEVNSSIKE